MTYRVLLRVFLRYSLGIGSAVGGTIALAVSFWTNVPPKLLAMGLMAPGLIIAPFLFGSDLRVDSIDEGAEAGFVSDDSSQRGFSTLSFPGRLQFGFLLVGIFLVGVVLFLIAPSS